MGDIRIHKILPTGKFFKKMRCKVRHIALRIANKVGFRKRTIYYESSAKEHRGQGTLF